MQPIALGEKGGLQHMNKVLQQLYNIPSCHVATLYEERQRELSKNSLCSSHYRRMDIQGY